MPEAGETEKLVRKTLVVLGTIVGSFLVLWIFGVIIATVIAEANRVY